MSFYNLRRLLITTLPIILVACSSAPKLPPSTTLVSVDFLGTITTAKSATRLLSWHNNRLYFALENGSVLVTDDSGSKITELPAKISGNKLLSKPQAVAFTDEHIYVVDSGTDQVVIYQNNGKLEGVFGKSGDGRLRSPQGIAIHDGIVYVADSGHSRIQLFGINGVVLSTLNINTNPRNLERFSDKEETFKLDEPIDIALDQQGRVFVLDANNSRIRVYDQNGLYLNTLPKGGKIIDMVISDSGIFAIDTSSYSVNQYGFDLRLITSIGSKGEGKGQFKSLNGVAINTEHHLYIGDHDALAVHKYKAKPVEPQSIKDQLATRESVKWVGDSKLDVSKFAWDGEDTLYAINEKEKSIIKLAKGERTKTFKIKDFTPVSLAVANDGMVWAIDGENYRIVKLDEIGNIVNRFGTKEKMLSDGGAGEFDAPVDIAISSKGLIFIADQDNHWIQVFNKDGIYINTIRQTLNKQRFLDEPSAIAFDPYDNLYVLDKSDNTIFIFSADGKPKGQINNKEGKSPGNLKDPTDLMANHHTVLVLDDNRIKVYSHDGDYLYSMGGKGSDLGQFDKPIAISPKTDDTFTVSDSGNAKLQSLTTLYKPVPIKAFVAKGDMHAVHLSWQAVDLPYIDHYQVYRAEAENGPFTKLEPTIENKYHDKNLDADKTYYYLVSAVTQFGYEGTMDTLVNAATTRYIPVPPQDAQAIPDKWQIELKWTPLSERYSSSYLIYKKSATEKEEYSKIGATSEPSFVIKSLEPNTDYTFYISAISTDGIESEKVSATATTKSSSASPLEITILEMQNIFSNTYKIYEQDGIGTIRLTNNTGSTMNNINIGFMLKDFMDFPTGSQIAMLEPGQSKEITLKAVFNNNILTVTEDTPVQTELTASYFSNNVKKQFIKNHTTNIYEKHRLSWDNHGRFASFITPKDPLLLSYVRSIATQFKETHLKAQSAANLFNSLGIMGLTYIQDPTNPYQVTSGKTDFVDYIQYPRETLERKSGDCDDLVALYSAALESLGIETRVIEVPGHMLMMFNTGIAADSDGYTMENMYVIHDEMLWIPVETTLVGSSFLKAWETGSQKYYQWKDNGLTLLDIQQSWRTFKPASLPQAEWKPAAISRKSIEEAFPGEFMSVLKIGIQTKIRPYSKQLETSPNDIHAHMQIGIIYAKAGELIESMKYFDKIIEMEPNNAAAHNNRGNILMLEDKPKEAINAYTKATESDANDALIWINLAKTYKALNDTNRAKEAFIKAVDLDPSIKNSYRVMALELLNTL